MSRFVSIVNYTRVWRCAGNLKPDNEKALVDAGDMLMTGKREQLGGNSAGPSGSCVGGINVAANSNNCNNNNSSSGSSALNLGLTTKFSKKGSITVPNQVPLH